MRRTLWVRHPFVVPYWRNGEIAAALVALAHGIAVERERFTREFRGLLRRDAGLATGSGRLALELALRLSGCRPGDEVILPTFACAALVAAVRRVDATPLFADIDRTFNVTADTVERALSVRTRAVVVVHTGGRRADVDAIAGLLRGRAIALVEDCAQATGGETDGRPWGTSGDFAIHSFGMGKNVMATAGGFLAGDSLDGVPPLAEEGRWRSSRRLVAMLLRYRLARYTRPFVIALSKSRGAPPEDRDDPYAAVALSEMDAAMLRRQLPALRDIVSARQRNANALLAELGDHPALVLPDPAHHLFTKFFLTLRARGLDADALRAQVTALVRRLLRAGFEPELVYTPLHLRMRQTDAACPVAEDLYRRTLALPVRPGLGEDDCRRLAAVIRSHFGASS